jgi:Protein of unknown function (DUF2510)
LKFENPLEIPKVVPLVSLTSAAGSGGAVTPGWYTDPHDPRQLRWWSGEGWTEHVSPAAGEPQATQATQAQEVPAQATPAQSAQDVPLPSRRALRDPATEASEAAEAALAAQAAQQQAQAAQEAVAAQQAQAAQQQAAAAQQAQQQAGYDAQQSTQSQNVAPVAAGQPSAPIPTLPVATTSFLEQQGYAPLGGAAPADANGWSQPAQPAQPVQPAQSLPPVETAQPNAWNQPLQPVGPAQPAQPIQPIQPAQPAQTLPPVETAQPNAWNQPVQPPSSQPTAWNQPLQPVQPEQPVWGAPTTGGVDNLFGSASADQTAAQNPQESQWGLTPTDADATSRRRTDEVSGSSSVWSWLIAISPLLAAGAITYVLLAVKPALTDWPFEAAVAAPYLLVLLFALADRAVLLRLGHSQPRSPAWALLTAPVYLIARAGETRREDGSGTALTLVWFVSFVVAVVGIVGYGLLTHQALIVGLPT